MARENLRGQVSRPLRDRAADLLRSLAVAPIFMPQQGLTTWLGIAVEQVFVESVPVGERIPSAAAVQRQLEAAR